jgi:hypothetical protein
MESVSPQNESRTGWKLMVEDAKDETSKVVN